METNEVKTNDSAGAKGAVAAKFPKLADILKDKVGVNFEFIEMFTEEDQDGGDILRLVLKEPIAIVMGSQRVRDVESGDVVPLQATDVEMVSIGRDTLDTLKKMEEEGIQVFFWNKIGVSGRVQCKFRLDVAKRDGGVWITEKSFSSFGNNQRRKSREASDAALVARIRESKTRAALGNAVPAGGKPEATA